MPINGFLTPWVGAACRHIAADAAYGVLDFRFAGRSPANRWNRPNEPTRYLASDQAVAIAEFARHLNDDLSATTRRFATRRRIYDLRVRLDATLDLRDLGLCAELSIHDAPSSFLDCGNSRAVAGFLRSTTPAQALLVPSMAFLDNPERWLIVLLLEKLPTDPALFLPAVTADGVFGLEL